MSRLIKAICLCCFAFMPLMSDGANESDASISVGRQGSIYSVNASITLPATPCESFRLLTDYDSLPSYIPGMLETRFERITKNTVKVWQTGEVSILFFRVRIRSQLEVEEIPNQQILFRQQEGDMKTYSGEWDFMEAPGGTRVVYASTLSPRHYVPAFLARSILEREIGKLFNAILKETIARKNRVSAACVAQPSSVEAVSGVPVAP